MHRTHNRLKFVAFYIVGTGPDPNKAPCKKAKQLRRERKLEKLKEKDVNITTLSNVNKNKEKRLEDFINELPKEFQQRLQVKSKVFKTVMPYSVTLPNSY